MHRLLAAVMLFGVPAIAIAGPPSWLHLGPHTVYDGVTDDLVTGGLGAAAMRGAPPGYADPLKPTAAELRRAALFQPASAAEGYGRLFGPEVDPETGRLLPDHGKIAGEEYLAYADDGTGRQNVAMLLQIPFNISTVRRCLVAVAISGAAGLFRDVVDFGYWGLRRRCAVVYTDKGEGNGFDFLERDSVNLLDGRQVSAERAGRTAQFRADLDDQERRAFLQDFPHRIAFKAAHSKQNPQMDWGEDVLRAIGFAFFQLGQRDAGYTPANTLVIATGRREGGGAAIYAAERDHEHLIDGVVVRGPQVHDRPDALVIVTRGHTTDRRSGRPLLDYLTFADLYQPCAALAVPGVALGSEAAPDAERCASLHDRGLLVSGTVRRQAQEALDHLHSYGWEKEADVALAQLSSAALHAAAATYANAYGRFDVRDRLCDRSFAPVDAQGRPMAILPAELAQNFAIARGLVPAGRLAMINDSDPGGPRQASVSVSRSTGRQDADFDGAMCLRSLLVNKTFDAQRVQAGMREVIATGRLDGLPTIIVQGRNDPWVPPNFSARPYAALNSLADGKQSQLHYIEVTNAADNDPAAPTDAPDIPLVLYHLRALDAMWAYLTAKVALPPSQVVHTHLRHRIGDRAPVVRAEDVPPIAAMPSPRERIMIGDGYIEIPN